MFVENISYLILFSEGGGKKKKGSGNFKRLLVKSSQPLFKGGELELTVFI